MSLVSVFRCAGGMWRGEEEIEIGRLIIGAITNLPISNLLITTYKTVGATVVMTRWKRRHINQAASGAVSKKGAQAAAMLLSTYQTESALRPTAAHIAMVFTQSGY